MPPPETGRNAANDERARGALTVGVAVVLVFFTAGLFMSLRGLGIDIAPGPVSPGVSEPATVNGVLTYVRVDRGGHAVQCSSTYSSSQCSTVAVVDSRRRSSK